MNTIVGVKELEQREAFADAELRKIVIDPRFKLIGPVRMPGDKRDGCCRWFLDFDGDGTNCATSVVEVTDASLLCQTEPELRQELHKALRQADLELQSLVDYGEQLRVLVKPGKPNRRQNPMDEAIKKAIKHLACKSTEIETGAQQADQAMKYSQAALNLAHVASIMDAIEREEKKTGAGS